MTNLHIALAHVKEEGLVGYHEFDALLLILQHVKVAVRVRGPEDGWTKDYADVLNVHLVLPLKLCNPI